MTLLYVAPRPAADNGLGGAAYDAQLFGDAAAAQATGHERAYLADNLRRQGRARKPLAARLAPLRHLVDGVVGSCPEKEMARVHTCRVIATVQHAAGAGGAIGKLPRHPVTELDAPRLAAANLAVPGGVPVGQPFPARTKLRAVRRHWAVLVHLGPEAAGESFIG